MKSNFDVTGNEGEQNDAHEVLTEPWIDFILWTAYRAEKFMDRQGLEPWFSMQTRQAWQLASRVSNLREELQRGQQIGPFAKEPSSCAPCT